MSATATHAEFMVRDSRQPGHFWADNEILDLYGPKLGPHGLAVYMAMCRRADNSTGECMLSTRRIAEQVAMSKGGVFNALLVIVTLGLARKVLESVHGKPAVYVLADVKELGRSSGERRCSSGERVVHPVNAQYGKKDFLKTKPTPPTPLSGGSTIRPRDVRKVLKEMDRLAGAWVGMDEWSKDQRIDAIIRAHGMDPDTFYKAQAWMRAPRPTWADNPDYNEALRTTTGDNGHA